MRQAIINALPNSNLEVKKIVRNQGVHDIITEVLQAHKIFAKDYDRIAAAFWVGNEYATLNRIFDFCKREMMYLPESESKQTTRSPAALLKTANSWGVDCKHYAGFIGGILDALNRRGKKFDWVYRFVSYDQDDRLPGHVFIVVKVRGNDIFVDPVLGTLNERYPKYYYSIDKKIKMLSRITGFGDHNQRLGYVQLGNDFDVRAATNYVPSPAGTVVVNSGGAPVPMVQTLNSGPVQSLPAVQPAAGSGWTTQKILIFAAVGFAAYYLLIKKR